MRSRILLALTFLALRPGAEAQKTDTDEVITGLHQVTSELEAAVRHLNTELDREIAMHDRGFRSRAGQRIPGADTDLITGQADVVQTAMRKLVAARLLAVSRAGYEPAPVAAMEKIQALIAEARTRINRSNEALKRMLVVSAKDLNSRADAAQQLRRFELRKARNAAGEAARKALVALPIELPEADTPEEQREKAWEAKTTAVSFEPGKRVILVNEHFCRITLSDSGMEDRQGRRLFYQEQWVTRTGSVARTNGTGPAGIVMWMRWAVALNPATGQHTLLRRYETREFQGSFDDLYELYRPMSAGAAAITSVKLTEGAGQPSVADLGAGVTSLESAGRDLQKALSGFRARTADALGRNEPLAGENELPAWLQQKLFAIRAHLAGVTQAMEAEHEVRAAIERADRSLRELEARTAFVNANLLETEGVTRASRALLDVESRADMGIVSISALEKEALEALPPDLAAPEVQLPALGKNVILRIRRLGASPAGGGTIRFRQEVWNLEAPQQGPRQVKRSIVHLDIDPKQGRQTLVSADVKFYPIDPGELLEEIYDENAAQ